MKLIHYKNIRNYYTRNNTEFQKKYWDNIWNKKINNTKFNLIDLSLFLQLKRFLRKSNKIIEAGCGDSRWAYNLHNLGYNVEGVDFAERTIKQIKNRFPYLKIFFSDVRNLNKYKNDSIDIYLSFGVVEHFPEGPLEILEEAYRVLKPNGILFLTIPYLNKIRLIKLILGRKYIGSGNFYQYIYSLFEILDYISNVGFTIIKVKRYDFFGGIYKDLKTIFNLFKHIKDFIIKSFYKKSQNIELELFNINKYYKNNINISFKQKLFIILNLIFSNIESHSLLIIAKK